MKNKMQYKTGLALAALALFTVSTFGADAVAAAPVAARTNWGLLLIPILVPVVIAAAKLFIPKLPGWSLPIIAPLLGALADYLMTGTFGQGTIMGAIAGSAGVGLREIADQVQKASKPIEPPK